MKSCLLFVINRLSTSNYFVEFIDPFYLYIDWGKSINTSRLKSNISTKHKDKLSQHTKTLLNKFPNTSQIEFIYEDELKGKKRLKKNKKK